MLGAGWTLLLLVYPLLTLVQVSLVNKILLRMQRFFKDFGGELYKGSIIMGLGGLILIPLFCSYFRGKPQANLHGIL